MLATHVTKDILTAAAAKVGIRMADYQSQTRPKGQPRHRFVLRTINTYTPNGMRVAKNGHGPYTALRRQPWAQAKPARRIASVCWHGHREFFRAVFALAPDAKLSTKLAKYTADNFEATFGPTGEINIGSRMYPQPLHTACACETDSDRAMAHIAAADALRTGGWTTINPSRCPFSIFTAEHYRADGSCKCDDAEHREHMIAEWEYSAEDFASIPLR